jgi:hypothetical protein
MNTLPVDNPWETATTAAAARVKPTSYTETAGPKVAYTDSNSNTVSNQSQSSQGSKTVNTQNMPQASLAALEALITQLMSGGTPQMKEELNRVAYEMAQARGLRSEYSKSAAFNDASGAMAQTLRQSLEKMLPSIHRAAEGSGTSANSMRALLLQDAATRSSEAASAIGLKAAVDYGNISTNLTNALATLAGKSDPVTAALINALNISKGSVTNTQEDSSSYTQGSTVSNTTGSSVQYTPETSARREYDTPMMSNTSPKSDFDYVQPASSLAEPQYYDPETARVIANLVNNPGYESPAWGNYSF